MELIYMYLPPSPMSFTIVYRFLFKVNEENKKYDEQRLPIWGLETFKHN